jgi:hypothetical protein
MASRKRSAAPPTATVPSKVSKKGEEDSTGGTNQSSVELVELEEAAQKRLEGLLSLDLTSPDFQTPAKFAARFQQIADVLLKEAVLYICHVPWRLAEIEFYFQCKFRKQKPISISNHVILSCSLQLPNIQTSLHIVTLSKKAMLGGTTTRLAMDIE